MELNQYIKILKQNVLAILIITSISVIIGMLYSSSLTPGYKLEQVYIIQSTQAEPSGQPPKQEIPSVGPSAMDEARNFTDTAVALLKSRDLNPESRVSAEKVAPQLIKVIVVAKNREDAKSDMERVIISFNTKIKDLVEPDNLQIKAVGSQPEATVDILDKKIILILSFFVGLTSSVFLISLKNYFKL